jgi:hypothetical protein
MKFVTFYVIDMHYPYDAIFGRGLHNTFKATLHSAYHCLKVPALLGVILVRGTQKDVRNIEQGFAPEHINVNCLHEEEGVGQQDMRTPKIEASITRKIAIEPE